jgi:hypothetical protein
MRGLMVAQTFSVSLNSSSDELCKFHGLSDGSRQIFYISFFRHPLIVRLITTIFKPRSQSSIAFSILG